VLNLLTTIIEVLGLLVLVAAVALATFYAVPQPWSVPAALAVAGGGLLGASFIIVPPKMRRKAGSR
jgi:hypothetical protein